jgi:hypothetical protein
MKFNDGVPRWLRVGLFAAIPAGQRGISASIPHVVHPADEQGFISVTTSFF